MQRRSFLTAAAAVLAVIGTATLGAQQTTQVHPGKGGSPHVKSEWTAGGAKISITYGRPSLKGRPLSQLAPDGQPWRTGADEATTLVSDKPLKFGTLTVPAGEHTLYTLPGATGWELIVSTKTGQWGIPYPEGSDLGRAPMKLGKTKAPVEQLTISIDPSKTGGTLRVEWGGASASIPFTVG
jgi:hypothetical protein